MGFLLQTHGIVSQAGASTGSRPTGATRITLDALIQQTGDNTFQFHSNTNQAFSIAHWLKIGSANPQNFIYTTGRETSSSNRHHQIYAYTSGPRIDFLTQTGGSPNGFNITTGFTEAPQPEQWYFLVATADNTVGKKLYFYDETGFITSGFTSVYPGINVNNNFKFMINAARTTGTGNYVGVYNSFGVWNRQISDAEIEELWNNGNGLSYSDLNAGLLSGITEWFDLGDWNGSNVTGNHAGTVMVKAATGTITNEPT